MVGWARVYPAIQRTTSKALRRGAWYPVIHDNLPDRVFLQLGTRSIAVPRRILEIRRERPDYFSVVYRRDHHGDALDDSSQALAMRYVVCPRCARRLRIWGQPPTYCCPNCRHEGDIGWWEA